MLSESICAHSNVLLSETPSDFPRRESGLGSILAKPSRQRCLGVRFCTYIGRSEQIHGTAGLGAAGFFDRTSCECVLGEGFAETNTKTRTIQGLRHHGS